MLAHHVCACPRKFTLGNFSSILWNRSKPLVVHLELPMHQDRYTVLAGKRVDPLHFRRVTFDAELLFGNHLRATLQVTFDLAGRLCEIGHLVGAKQESIAMSLDELITVLVAERLRLQAIGNAGMRRGPHRWAASWQQNRRRRANSALVREQHFVWTAAVAEVLVDVYDGLG